MTQLILLPILFQACLAVLLLFFYTKTKTQKVLSIAGSSVNLVIASLLFYTVWVNGSMSVQAGNWSAPFGITFVADTLAVTMVLLTAIVGFAVSVFSAFTIARDRLRFGYFSILHFLLMGLAGSFLTGDIFNLYVWFEIILISSFVLLTIGSEKKQLEGAVKYFALNMLASIMFLTALGILYGLTGTLNMADLSGKVAALENRGLVNVCALFFFIGFGIKAALFPLYAWLPDSYHAPPTAVTAIFSGLLTKVAVYALIRVFSVVFVVDEFFSQLFIILAVITIFSGGIGALVQTNIRKFFSYLIICHIGYMIIGLGLFNEIALAGMVFYLIHDVVIKTNLFLISGVIVKIKGTSDMRKLGDIYNDYPKLALLFALSLFSLIGIPPLSGFWPKVSLILGGMEADNYLTVGFILFGSFITLVVVAKLWAQVFWKSSANLEEHEDFSYFNKLRKRRKVAILFPVVFLTLVTLYIGFGAESVNTLATRIAGELINVQPYIDTVMGK
ncbi:Na+/H+ antiporter subunit D [Cryomorpha ignava]|uniref:Na+/H+ antiporter subunit D n=1 Tax=Cryomorpha ignava TaxID=101383 RepID=A0A7K3WT05_9FLAO|nr:proton-conducting transporter membrane subunit [Cryomorpha ignava]NEN24668.1 Na+/H+ antiporter subunit D [Cryomorpha ignava]